MEDEEIYEENNKKFEGTYLEDGWTKCSHFLAVTFDIETFFHSGFKSHTILSQFGCFCADLLFLKEI